jgi:hypothetical protein
MRRGLLLFFARWRDGLGKLDTPALGMQRLNGGGANKKRGTREQQRFRGRHAQTPVVNGLQPRRDTSGAESGAPDIKNVEQEQGKPLSDLAHLQGAPSRLLLRRNQPAYRALQGGSPPESDGHGGTTAEQRYPSHR